MKKLRIILQSNYIYLIILIISLIYTFINIIFVDKKSIYDLNNHEFIVEIQKIRYKDNKTIIEFSAQENLISYYNDSFPYKIGDKLKIIGTLEEPKNNTIPNLFNYKKYLYNNDIYYFLNIEKITLLKENNNIIYKLKNFLIDRINSINSNKEYLYAFILGETYYIDKDIKKDYQFNGVSHLLAIGSTNITLITFLFTYLFQKFKLNDYLYLLIMILLVVMYIILTDYSVSITRCGLTFLILYINKKLKLNIKYKNLLLLIASFSLLYNPYYIYDLSFQYSYLVSITLVIYSDLIKGNYLKKLLIVSFIAYLISVPINIYNNFEINFLSIMLNLLYVPLINFIIFPLTILVMIFPFFSNILNVLIYLTEQITKFFGNIKVLSFILSKPNLFLLIIYYIVIIYTLNGLVKKKYYRFFSITLLLILHYNINIFIPSKHIIMLDVGQGDSIVFKSNNEICLIDTGGSIYHNYSDNIIYYLKSIGIRRIDYLILTHGDYDHMGEAINLVEGFKVEKVIFNCGKFNELEQDLIKVLDKNKISYYSCIKEVVIDDSKLYFLNNKNYGNENDNSSVIYTKLNNYKFLFMGDAGVEVEQDLIKKYNIKNIDVLKVGHHGSRTSSSKLFIDAINPKYSIISVGKNNRYGHPNKEVLDTLDESQIYRTDRDGSIMFKINKDKLRIETCTP